MRLAATDAAAVSPDAPFFQASHEVSDEVEHVPIAAPAENINSSAKFEGGNARPLRASKFSQPLINLQTLK